MPSRTIDLRMGVLSAATAIVLAFAAPTFAQTQQGQQRQPGQNQQQSQQGGTMVIIAVPREFQNMRAEQLIGKDIYGSGGEEIGEIEDIVIRSDGQAVAVLADIGGFLGLGAKRVAIPMDQLSMQDDRIVAKNLTQQTAENLPEYNDRDWRVFERSRNLSELP